MHSTFFFSYDFHSYHHHHNSLSGPNYVMTSVIAEPFPPSPCPTFSLLSSPDARMASYIQPNLINIDCVLNMCTGLSLIGHSKCVLSYTKLNYFLNACSLFQEDKYKVIKQKKRWEKNSPGSVSSGLCTDGRSRSHC